MADKKPTEAEIAAARELLARAATNDADAPRAALIALVTMPEFTVVMGALRDAFTLNMANTEAGYALSMLDRLRAAYTPA